MRVIAGSARGTRLQVSKVRGLRPTGDRARETLFNVIAAKVPGARVLDLFAGSGALGIEALSRGAASALFIEASGKAVAVLRDNLSRCRVDERAQVQRSDWRSGVRRLGHAGERFDLILADPPYVEELGGTVLECLAAASVPAADCLVGIEHRTGSTVVADGGWHLERELVVGDTTFSLFCCVATDPAPC